MQKNSGRNLVIGIVIVAAATLVSVILRERNKSVMFAMYGDVHNLATSQDAYFAEHTSFSGTYPPGYQPTHGASVVISHASDTSWSATATHPRTSRTCTLNYAQPRNATDSQRTEARIAAWKAYDCER
jgi:hypothetical protein